QWRLSHGPEQRSEPQHGPDRWHAAEQQQLQSEFRRDGGQSTAAELPGSDYESRHVAFHDAVDADELDELYADERGAVHSVSAADLGADGAVAAATLQQPSGLPEQSVAWLRGFLGSAVPAAVVRSQESGIRSQESGVRSQESGVNHIGPREHRGPLCSITRLLAPDAADS